MEDRAWHYLRPNEANRQPRRHIFVDTEARTERTGTQWVQAWRLGVAVFRHDKRKGRASESTVEYGTPEDLAKGVDEFTAPKSRTVLWAHNLGYDLRISQMFSTLPRLGWQVVGHNLSSHGTWVTWRKGDRSLVMVDSASVFPTSLAQVAKWFMESKEPLPSDVDDDSAWWARCHRDVKILRDAVVSYLEWVERDGLGNWQLTGAGQSSAAFRHRFLTHRMMVHADSDALSAERRAMWTGRCEAFWRGTAHHVRIDEWDLSLAYARIARDCDVPIQMLGPLPPKWTLERWLEEPGYAVLADVEVTTAKPVVPTLSGGRILWPVGTFETVLWDPELRVLLRAGASVRVRRAWLYRSAPALHDWADWVIGCLESPDNVVPAWRKAILKHWSRALIGRFAMTYRTWDDFGTLPFADCRHWTFMDKDSGETRDMIQLGRSVWISGDQVEWGDSMPMVTGWVMSRTRAVLWYLIEHAGPRVPLYVDTDSLLVASSDHAVMARLSELAPMAGLRVKRSWDRVTILGPRQLITGTQVRVSGVAKGAQPLPDGRLVGEVWESLAKAIKERRPGQVRITARCWRVRGVDHRRVLGDDGWTEPHRLPVPTGR